jgi:hypothetical protein
METQLASGTVFQARCPTTRCAAHLQKKPGTCSADKRLSPEHSHEKQKSWGKFPQTGHGSKCTARQPYLQLLFCGFFVFALSALFSRARLIWEIVVVWCHQCKTPRGGSEPCVRGDVAVGAASVRV